jgi:hypothetical protein
VLTRENEPVLAISTIGWVVRIIIAVVAMLAIYVVGASVVRKFKVEPDEEVDPEDVVPVDLRFRCIVCGAEVVMTSAQAGDEEPDAPRHCREDMIPVA